MRLHLVLPTALAVVATTVAARAADVPVKNATELLAAIAAAKPGDTIVLSDGTYALTGASCSANGTASQPITVKAATALGAKIRFDALEGFKVRGAHWHFEGLDIQGVCAVDSNCEHAFHVGGGGVGFVLRGSRVVDFNAQLKVNSDKDAGGAWVTPHGGLVEGNEIYDTRARATSNPTTKLNIDTGDGWVVRANFLHDFQKGGGDNVSYGAFMKSGGKNGVFERNLVWCEKALKGGTRIGLSFGGGGTAPQFCAPAFDASKPCDPEHTGGVMRNNVILACSDVGIYLNKSKDTKLLHNTLIATSGIDFRFASTTGEARANVLAGRIRGRDGGTFSGVDNLENLTAGDFAGFYVAPLAADLRKKGDLAKLLDKATATSVTDDYCARARSGAHDLGALEHSLGDCDTTKTWPGGGVVPPPPTDAGVDAAPSDAGSDAGVSDAAVSDAGDDAATPATDGGTAEGTTGDAGCGCRAPARTSPSAAAVALVGLAIAWLRRARTLSRRGPRRSLDRTPRPRDGRSTAAR